MENMNLNQEKLKEVANASDTAIATMMALSSRKRARCETNLTRIKDQLREMNENVSDKDYYSFWKGLEKAGVGALILGRRGKQTRFAWNYSLQDVAKLAIGEHDREPGKITSKRGRKKLRVVTPGPSTIQHGATQQSLAQRQERLIVKIPFRSDFTLEVSLPSDVSKEELEKIGNQLITAV